MSTTNNAKKIWKDFETKNLDEYRDLYEQSKTLLLDNVFKNFQNKSLEILKIKDKY